MIANARTSSTVTIGVVPIARGAGGGEGGRGGGGGFASSRRSEPARGGRTWNLAHVQRPCREHGAREHEDEADAHPDREGLPEHEDAEHRRDRGVDVRDDRRPDRPDLGDEREEDEERDRGADDREHENGGERVADGALPAPATAVIGT